MDNLMDFTKIPLIDENNQDYWEQWLAFTKQLDQYLFMLKLESHLFLTGGGTISFRLSSQKLEWTEDFFIPNFYRGFGVTISYGSSGVSPTLREQLITDGEVLFIDTYPLTMLSDNVVRQFKTAPTLTPANFKQIPIGFRKGDKIFLRSGSIIEGVW